MPSTFLTRVARSAVTRGLLLLAGAAPAVGAAVSAQNALPAGNKFEANVAAYEAADKATPPPQGAILLVGDSQFFRWKTLKEDLPGYTVVNRGIDSFQTSDLAFFAERLVYPYKPRFIVTHVGGNDVSTGKTTEQILTDFKTFVAKVRKTYPTVPIAFSSTTPGPGRWTQAAQRVATNKAFKDYVATQKNMHFIDLWDAMLKDGQPREDLWVEDRIHPNQAGYQIRVRVMKPLLGLPDQK
jgi:lysophospholipase L1-like esterase